MSDKNIPRRKNTSSLLVHSELIIKLIAAMLVFVLIFIVLLIGSAPKALGTTSTFGLSLFAGCLLLEVVFLSFVYSA